MASPQGDQEGNRFSEASSVISATRRVATHIHDTEFGPVTMGEAGKDDPLAVGRPGGRFIRAGGNLHRSRTVRANDRYPLFRRRAFLGMGDGVL